MPCFRHRGDQAVVQVHAGRAACGQFQLQRRPNMSERNADTQLHTVHALAQHRPGSTEVEHPHHLHRGRIHHCPGGFIDADHADTQLHRTIILAQSYPQLTGEHPARSVPNSASG